MIHFFHPLLVVRCCHPLSIQGFSKASALDEHGAESLIYLCDRKTHTSWFDCEMTTRTYQNVSWQFSLQTNIPWITIFGPSQLVQEFVYQPYFLILDWIELRIWSFLVCHQSSTCFSSTCRMMSNGCCYHWANFGKQIPSGLIKYPMIWHHGLTFDRFVSAFCILDLHLVDAAFSTPFWSLRHLWLKRSLAKQCCKVQHLSRRSFFFACLLWMICQLISPVKVSQGPYGKCLGCTRGFWLSCAHGLCLGCARGLLPFEWFAVPPYHCDILSRSLIGDLGLHMLRIFHGPHVRFGLMYPQVCLAPDLHVIIPTPPHPTLVGVTEPKF